MQPDSLAVSSSHPTNVKPALRDSQVVKPKLLIGTSAVRSLKINAKDISGKLNYADSIRIGLIEIYSPNVSVFEDNVLTRILHPIKNSETISSNEFYTITDSLVLSDSLNLKYKVDNQSTTIKLLHKELLQNPIVTQPLYNQWMWLVPMLIAIVAIIGYLRTSFRKYIFTLLKSTINRYTAGNLFKTVNAQNLTPSLLLSVLFIINTGVFIYESFLHYEVKLLTNSGFGFLSLIWLVVFAIFLLKNLAYWIIGYIFNNREKTSEFLFQVNVLNKVFGVVIIPFIVTIPFVSSGMTDVLILCVGILLVFMYVGQMMWGAKIILQQPISIFYLFLYLCTLEILPLALIAKVIFS